MADATLISVIIPCYNYGHYLPQAIQSIQSQTHRKTEIIVVDDGSTDNTAEIVKDFPDVTYVYQENQGLSAARNKGVACSKGAYLVFVDADDWLLPDALSSNLKVLKADKQLAFVAGSYIDYIESTGEQIEKMYKYLECSYLTLLRRNHIAMHAAVMYSRWVFDHFLFDPILRSCEDWDLYLRITRRFPVRQTTDFIAVYRRYNTSMSANFARMLESGMEVLKRQSAQRLNTEEREALKLGKERLKKIYTTKVCRQFDLEPVGQKREILFKVLWRYDKVRLAKYLCRSIFLLNR